MNRNQLIQAIVLKSIELAKANTEDSSEMFVILLSTLLSSDTEDLQAAYDDLDTL